MTLIFAWITKTSSNAHLAQKRNFFLWLNVAIHAVQCSKQTCNRAVVAQLVEHRAAMREVVSSTPAGPTLRVFK